MAELWLLRVDLGGPAWLLSTDVAAPVDDTGAALGHEPTLEAPEVSYGAVPGAATLGDFSASASFILPVSVAEMEAEGWPVSRGTAELSRWTPGTPYAARRRIARGDVVIEGHPVAGESISISLSAPNPELVASFPPSNAGISARNNSALLSSIPNSAEGYTGPWVFGCPGWRIDGDGAETHSPATPAPLIDEALGVQRVLLAYHATGETTIDLTITSAHTAGATATFTVDTLVDVNGRLLATADVSTYAVSWTLDGGVEIWATWTDGGLHWDNGADIRGLGDVALYLLRTCDGGAVFDLGAWQAVVPLLNRIEVGGYVNDIESAWTVINEELLALFPRAVVLWGPDGYYPAIFDDGDLLAGPTLTEDLDIILVDGARPQEVTDGGVTTVRVEYSRYPPTDTYLDAHDLGPGYGQTTETPSGVARRVLSYRQPGQDTPAAWTVSSAWLWRYDSAEVSAREHLDLLALPLVAVEVLLLDTDRLDGLPIGATVLSELPTLAWAMRPCWVGGHRLHGDQVYVTLIPRPVAG